jgi:glycosyltransferase involved in cell wall biosynthesis
MQGERNAVQYADEIIVLSEGVKQYFKTAYNRDTVFIPNGVSRPMKVEAEEITRLYGLKKDQYVLFLGRIVPEKGLSYLLDAYAQLRTDKKLVIAGGSSDTQGFLNDLQRRSENDKRIVFTGFVQGRVLGELYSNAYCYVLPSDLEGMPLSLLEAMSYGNCCVTSDIPECAEVVEDKALTFPRGNVDALAETLQMLVDNKKTVEEYRECAADFICKKYNWEHVVDKTIALYRGNDE